MRRKKSTPSALWWVVNGFAAAPPATDWRIGRLDLDELPILKEPADHRDDPRAKEQPFARCAVHDKVEVALAVHLLGVGEAVPLLGERPEGLGKKHARLNPHGHLAGLRLKERPPGADDVAEVELLEHGKGLVADDVLLQVDLDLALLVQQLGKLALAHVADRHEAARHGHRDRIVLAVDVGLQRLAREMGRLELGAERVRAGRPEVGKLLPAHCVLVMGDVGRDIAHVSGSTCRTGAHGANGNFRGLPCL